MPNELPPLVSADAWAKTPPAVQQAFLTLVDLVRNLDAQVTALRAQVTQTSRNSSKPPSSDPPSAPRSKRAPRGKGAGAQKGHPDQQRPFLPPEHVHETIICVPDTCSGCGTALCDALLDVAPRRCWQIWEVPAMCSARERVSVSHTCLPYVPADALWSSPC